MRKVLLSSILAAGFAITGVLSGLPAAEARSGRVVAGVVVGAIVGGLIAREVHRKRYRHYSRSYGYRHYSYQPRYYSGYYNGHYGKRYYSSRRHHSIYAFQPNYSAHFGR